jgi:hypothetical protein
MPPWMLRGGIGLGLPLSETEKLAGGGSASGSLDVNVQDPSSASEALVPAAEVDLSDSILSQCGSTHYARFHRDVKVGVAQDADGVFLQDLGDTQELSVPCTLANTEVSRRQMQGKGGEGKPASSMQQKEGRSGHTLTFKERFVSFIPRPIISPLWTKTQPTGVSSLFRASSAFGETPC